MFDLSIEKILVLAVIAVVIFGPDQLPKIASQVGNVLRELRRFTDSAKNDLRDGLGPEFADFDVTDLNPRRFVQKHLIDGLGLDGGDSTTVGDEPVPAPAQAQLDPGEKPPYDTEAT